jgi:hypothetical protein
MAGPLVQTELSRLLGRSSEQLPCSKPSVWGTTSGGISPRLFSSAWQCNGRRVLRFCKTGGAWRRFLPQLVQVAIFRASLPADNSFS